MSPIAGQTITWASHGLHPGQQVGANDETSLNNLPRDAVGSNYGQADVNCEDAAAFTRGRGGALGNLFNRCVYDYGSFFSIQADEKLTNYFLSGHYDISETLTANFEFAASHNEFARLNSLNPNAPALTIPTGTSYIDASGNIAWAANPGSVEDAYRRGIEPIEYANLTRMQGYSSAENGSWIRPLTTFTDANNNDQRFNVGLEWDVEIGGRSWVVDADFTASHHTRQSAQVQDTLSTHMELSLNGFGGPNCDPFNDVPGSGNAAYAASGGDFGAGKCYYFNPFGSSVWGRDGSLGAHSLELRNPPELYEWLLGRAISMQDYRQRVAEVVIAGDLFDTDAGPIGLALGIQQRRDDATSFVDSSLATDNLDFVFGAKDWSGKLTTTAFFAEIGIPIGQMVELNIAGRYEDFDEIGESTFDPKFTLLIRPTDDLTIRASGGSSFRVPSLLQSFGTITTVANQADLVGGTTYKPSITRGNPNLGPESADTWNIGFSYVPTGGPLEGLSIDFDYYNYEYEEIITREAGNALLAADNAAITDWIATNVPGSTCVSNNCPDAVAAIEAGVGNRRQVIRNASGILLRILPDLANADSAEVNGMDLTVSYRWDNDWGSWRVGAQSAWARTYDVQIGGNTIDAIGSYNFTNNVARPLPEWKVNLSASWSRDNHRLYALARYIDEVDEDIPLGTAGFFAAVARLAGNDTIANDMADGVIEDMITVDLQYNYNFGETAFFSDTNVTVGIQNIFDEEPPVVSYITAYDPRLHDARGRIFFMRVGASI